ncbi:Cof family protein [Treponema primitia ZAS-2]|uniref:Cof family protein n=1 Tax=Treponema primitia (strain ATCC BAA-887 / DSM 12427 / ZAS-2) TaxID=545694 RepID=F5YQ87_TREPZ|nr:HAD family hydrolase [Treponema primitia]AEF86626.1 Cof family protein [Treponema primitia ZAS-2]
MTGAKKAIFLDIDGTLVINRTGPFPEDTDMITAAHQEGHKIFLSTGRSLAHIPQELQEAPWLDGIIAGAGAQVLIGDKTVYHKWAPREILLPICAYYLKNDKFCVFEGENGVFGLNLPDRFSNTENILPITGADDFVTRYPDAIISKLTLGGQPSDPERLLLSEFFQINAFPNYFEGIILGESKSKGMGIILQTLGMARENTIAIGDSANDIDIICAAALGIAMGNASEELKALAGAITGNCGEGGVGQAIKRFVLEAD